MEWLRLYTEIRNDRKLRRLPPAQRWLWITLLTIASESPVRGVLLLSANVPVTIADLVDAAAIPLKDVKAGIQSFKDQDMLEDINGILHLKNWDKRQFESDNSTERVKRHRSKAKQEDETEVKRFNNVSVTPPDTDTDTDIKDKDLNILSAPAEPSAHKADQQGIFDYWNEQGIIKHKAMNDKLKRAINGALRVYSVDEIKQAVSNYAAILRGQQYYFTYKWPLKHFLERGLELFLDWEVCSSNYSRGDPKDTGEDLDAKYADIYIT